eukprot:jgi/Botrbrau1/17522/Bobra.0825s0001.1
MHLDEAVGSYVNSLCKTTGRVHDCRQGQETTAIQRERVARRFGLQGRRPWWARHSGHKWIWQKRRNVDDERQRTALATGNAGALQSIDFAQAGLGSSSQNQRGKVHLRRGGAKPAGPSEDVGLKAVHTRPLRQSGDPTAFNGEEWDRQWGAPAQPGSPDQARGPR